VDHDGRLWPCCSWYGESLLGLDAHKIPIAKAWRSEGIEELRRAHLAGSLPAGCRECADRGGF
jgi:hypothetical protein